MSGFRRESGRLVIDADPSSDKDYTIVLEDVAADGDSVSSPGSVAWFADTVGVVLHDPSVNAAPVTVLGKSFPAGTAVTVWITSLPAAPADVRITCRYVTAGGRKDDRSFTLCVREQ